MMIPNQFLTKSLRLLPMLAVMAGIFFMSNQPGSSLSLPPILGVDKLLHGMAYAVLAASVIHAFPSWLDRPCGVFAGMGVVLFCLLYGISDEFHQTFIPARTATVGDLVADATGALLWVVVARRRKSGAGE
ncbi:VanZ family protein [Thermodesulfobacteriota bacterium]